MPKIVLICGLPGSGKSTLAKSFTNYVHLEADMYFVKNGVYTWNPNWLFAAHNWCLKSTEVFMQQGKDIVVTNTFCTKRARKPYLDMAEFYRYDLLEKHLFDAGLTDQELADRNQHGVSVETILNMRRKYVH